MLSKVKDTQCDKVVRYILEKSVCLYTGLDTFETDQTRDEHRRLTIILLVFFRYFIYSVLPE